jgi:predicted transcriptional regulator
MSDSPKPSAPEPEAPSKYPFSLKRIGEFVADVLRLERNVVTLTARLERLQEHNARMQRQLDEQTGQLKQLSQFLHDTLNERIDARAERTTLHLIQTIVAAQAEAEQERLAPPAKKSRPKKKT